MDKAALIGLAASAATLKRTRLRSVEGRLLSKMPTAGQLRIATTVALTENSDAEWVSTIGLRMEGYPKTDDGFTGATEQRTFFVEVVAQGTYTWPELPQKQTLEEAELARMLGRPIYLLAAAEVQALVAKLGLSGIRVATDIPRSDDAGNVPLEEADKKKIARRLIGEVARPKKVPVKKTRGKA